MFKRFGNAKVCALLILLLMSACQPSPANAPTNPPPPATVSPADPADTQPQASADAVRIQLQDTTMQVSPGDLESNATRQWVFAAEQGQMVTVNVIFEPFNGGVFSIWGADGTVLAPDTLEISTWQGAVPTTQDYYIAVRSVSTQTINYTLTLRMAPLTPPEATRIEFQPNATFSYTNGDLAPNAKIRFVLGALGGQQMNVTLMTEPAESAYLYIWDADGTVYTLMAPTQTWSGVLPSSLDYYIEVRSASAQDITYQLNVEIPAGSGVLVPEPPKIAIDQTIRFDAGPMDLELNGAVISGERDRYTLSLLAGEILSVVISSVEANAAFSILGPDQTPVPGTEEYKSTIQWSIPIPADGTYAILVGPTRGNATYTLQVQVSKP